MLFYFDILFDEGNLVIYCVMYDWLLKENKVIVVILIDWINGLVEKECVDGVSLIFWLE